MYRMSDDSSVFTIEFTCTVYKVQTLADGGIRVSLDLPDSSIMQAGALMHCQLTGHGLNVSCDPYDAKPAPVPPAQPIDADLDAQEVGDLIRRIEGNDEQLV